MQAQSCAPILVEDEEFAVDFIKEEIEQNNTIDPAAMVIPWESNVCFMEYGPSHSFIEQIQRIQDQDMSLSLFDMINNYINQLSQSAVDAVQRGRE